MVFSEDVPMVAVVTTLSQRIGDKSVLSVSFSVSSVLFPLGTVFLVAPSSAPGLAGSQVTLQAVVLVCWFCLGLAAAKHAAGGCSGSSACVCLALLEVYKAGSECISSSKSSFSLVVSHQRATACVAAGQFVSSVV